MTSTGRRTSSAASAGSSSTLRSSRLDDDVCALDVAEGAQARPQALLCDRLRNKVAGAAAPAPRTATGRASEKSDEVAALQLIELHRVLVVSKRPWGRRPWQPAPSWCFRLQSRRSAA